jgi:hypothetical protein
MSLRTKHTITTAGTPPTFSAATASDTFPVGSRLFAVYRSTHSSSIAVTAVVPGTLATGDVYPDKVYTLAIGSVTMQEVWIPLLKEYQDPTTGVATITTASQTAITCAVVER